MSFISSKSSILFILISVPIISFGNNEPQKTINYNDCPSDSLLNYCIKKSASKQSNRDSKVIISKASVFTDIKTIQRIEDSLLKNNIQFTSLSETYNVDLLKTYQLRLKKVVNKNDYYDTDSYSAISAPGGESDKGLDLYYVGRTVEENGKQSVVQIITLKTPDPLPQFALDSIGNLDETVSFSDVDNYINSLKTYDTSNLALRITKPFKTELEKVRAIFMWLNKNIQYDYIGLATKNFTVDVPDVLQKRVAVCDGYSRLFYYLCSGAGIISKYLSGLTPNGEHAWNAVRIDKRWYLIDATWGMKYFLIKPDVFIQDHFPLNQNKWTLLPNRISQENWKRKIFIIK